MANNSEDSDLRKKHAKTVPYLGDFGAVKTKRDSNSPWGKAPASKAKNEKPGPAKESPPKKRSGARGFVFSGGSFQGYKVAGSLSSQGAEADIYLLEGNLKENYVLRLYRDQVEPSPGILQKLTTITDLLGERVVRTLYYGLDNRTKRFYEIQEYIKGGDLEALLQKSRMDAYSVRNLAGQVSETLDILHSNGLLHRDVKPSNILVRSETPLKVALGDFGISSVLAANISIKETQMANTPLYAAPEAFADFASAAGDFWSLGAVLLECLNGVHPLEGLSVNMVMREICSRGIKVPDNFPPDLERLLKGLLTRDDKKRWKHKEVTALLAGDLKVPIFEEKPAHIQAEAPLGKPGAYRLDGQEFSSLKELACYFNQGPREWDMGRELLARGIIRSWLMANGNEKDAFEMDLKLCGNPEDNIFIFTRAFFPECPPLYRGFLLSLENLSVLLKNRNDLSDNENIVLTNILSGKLTNFPQIAISFGAPLPETLAAALSPPSPVTHETLVCALVAFDNKDDYIWGSQGPPNTKIDAIAFVLEAGCPLVSWDYFKSNTRPHAKLPESYLLSFDNPKIYKKTAEDLIKAINDGQFTTRSLIGGTKFKNPFADSQ